MPKIIRVPNARSHTGAEKDGQIYFEIYKGPASKQVCALVKCSAFTGQKEAQFSKTRYGDPVRPAWEELRNDVERYEAQNDRVLEILVYDLDELFPDAR